MVPLVELNGNGVHTFSDEERSRYSAHAQSLKSPTHLSNGDLGDAEEEETMDRTAADSILDKPAHVMLGEENKVRPLLDAGTTAHQGAQGAEDLAQKIQGVIDNMEKVQGGAAASAMESSMAQLHVAAQESEIDRDLLRTMNAAKFVKERIDDGNIEIGARGVERAQKTGNWEDHKPQRLTKASQDFVQLGQHASKKMTKVRAALAKVQQDFTDRQNELVRFGLGEAQDSGSKPWLEEDKQHLSQAVEHLHYIAQHLRTAATTGEEIH